jgi:hypothetical protein
VLQIKRNGIIYLLSSPFPFFHNRLVLNRRRHCLNQRKVKPKMIETGVYRATCVCSTMTSQPIPSSFLYPNNYLWTTRKYYESMLMEFLICSISVRLTPFRPLLSSFLIILCLALPLLSSLDLLRRSHVLSEKSKTCLPPRPYPSCGRCLL